MTGYVDSERIERVHAAIHRAGLDGILCTMPENLLMLTGYWSRIGLSLMWFPAEGDPALLAPETELEIAETGWVRDIRGYAGELDAARPRAEMSSFVSERLRKVSGKIGYEASFAQIAPPPLAGEPHVIDKGYVDMLATHVGQERLQDATDLIYELRSRKTSHEIEQIRRANQIAGIGLKTFQEMVAPGQSEIEIATSVERAIAVAGMQDYSARSVRAWAQICSGPSTAKAWRLYVQASTRRLEPGDLVMLELGTVVDGYWSDLTRVAVAGQPTQQQLDIWQIVADAQNTAVLAIQPGVTGRAVDTAARGLIAAPGYGDAFVHVTGHGVGFRYHELPPLLSSTSEDLLTAGMITSVEPGIYLSGWGGIRLEDNVLVTESGAERLSTASLTLTP